MHGPVVVGVCFNMRWRNLISRQRNLSKQCLLRYLCLNIKIFLSCLLGSVTVVATQNLTMLIVCPSVYIVTHP